MNYIEIDVATDEDIQKLVGNLIIYNNSQVPFTQNPPFIPLQYCIKANNEIIGGILAQINCWNSVSIEAVWVDNNHQRKGIATKLIEKVEQEAKNFNCTIAQLDTFDFQARELYEKLGYNIFGVIEDNPKGHSHFYMSKKL